MITIYQIVVRLYLKSSTEFGSIILMFSQKVNALNKFLSASKIFNVNSMLLKQIILTKFIRVT